MDTEGGFNQTDSLGFIRINAIRLMEHHAIIEANRKKPDENASVEYRRKHARGPLKVHM